MAKKKPKGKPKGKPKKPRVSKKPKVVSSQQKEKQAFKRKLRFINKRITEIYDFFGEHSQEYEEIQNLVLTQLGISNPRNAQFAIQSISPLNFSTSNSFVDEVYEDPNQIFSEIYKKLKGKTVYKIVKEKYSDKLNNARNLAEFNKNARKIQQAIKTDNVSKLDLIVKNLPSFYDALSQTDSYFQAEYYQKFSEYGRSKDESQAKEIMDKIQQYFQGKMQEGNKIKFGVPLNSEDLEDYPFMQEYTPQIFSGNDKNEEPDWGSAISKLKK